MSVKEWKESKKSRERKYFHRELEILRESAIEAIAAGKDQFDWNLPPIEHRELNAIHRMLNLELLNQGFFSTLGTLGIRYSTPYRSLFLKTPPYSTIPLMKMLIYLRIL